VNIEIGTIKMWWTLDDGSNFFGTAEEAQARETEALLHTNPWDAR